jgi:hypothetical protein
MSKELLNPVITAAEKLPEALKANALKLIKDMTTERMGIGDRVIRWRPSTLRIVQGTTDTSAIDGDVKLGDLVFGSVPAPKGARIATLRSWDSRQMWDPDQNNARVVCSSPDGKTGWRFGDCRKCENSKFQGDTPALCRQQKTFLAATEDLSEIIQIDLSRTQLKIGAEWEKKLSKMAVMPFQRIFELNVKRNEKNKNIFNLDPTRTDDYTSVEVTEFLNALFDYFVERRKEELKSFYDNLEDYKARKAESGKEEESSETAEEKPQYAEVAAGEDLPKYDL